jgi:hypothetical protein
MVLKMVPAGAIEPNVPLDPRQVIDFLLRQKPQKRD